MSRSPTRHDARTLGGTIDAAGQIFTLSGNISDNALSSGGAVNIISSNDGGHRRVQRHE